MLCKKGSIFILSGFFSLHAMDEEIPLELFFKPPQISEARMSPTGRYISMVNPSKDRMDAVIVDLEGDRNRRFRGRTRDDVDLIRWASDEKFVFSVTLNNLYAGGLFSGKVNSSKVKVLNEFDALRIVDGAPNNERAVLVRIFDTQRGKPRVVRYHPSTERGATIAELDELPGKLLSVFGDGMGGVAACTRYVDQTLHVYWYEANAKEWHRADRLSDVGDGSYEILGFDHGNTTFWINTYLKDNDTATLFKVPMDPNQKTEEMWTDSEYDLWDTSSLITCKYSQEVLGLLYDQKGPRVEWFNQDMKNIQLSLDQTYRDTMNYVSDFSRDRSRLLIYSYSDRVPPTYRVLDIAKGVEIASLSSRPELLDKELKQQYLLRLEMRDGLKLQAYLTLPGPTTEGPYPTVVLAHGGPWARDTWGFDAEVQMLANRGFAVFQLNYRGSSGYGKEISEEYSGDFKAMIEDLIDGAGQIIARKWADPRRIAIMGSSFGGYAAVAAQMYAPDLFRCSISHAGVFDMEEQIENWRSRFWKKTQGTYAYDRWIDIVGDPESKSTYIRAISPIYHVDKIKKPILLVHGKSDRVVDDQQTRDMVRALKQAGNEPESLYLSFERHGIQSMKNRIKYYEKVLEFLGEHLN